VQCLAAALEGRADDREAVVEDAGGAARADDRSNRWSCRFEPVLTTASTEPSGRAPASSW